MRLQIDPSNGHIFLDDIAITPKTTIDELKNSFVIGEQMIVSVGNKEVDCIFCTATLNLDGKEFSLSLRFESTVLVSAFIDISDPAIPVATDDEFYGSIETRTNLHQHWLDKQLGKRTGGFSEFEWGSAGVGRDKSENVFIFIHNNNNTWVNS
jgi:hypothetical protein